MKTGVFIIGGDYPLGSAALRKRMMHYGLEKYDVKTELIHYFPAVTYDDYSQSEVFVKFFLKPIKKEISTEKKINRSVFSILSRIRGILRVIQYLKQRNIDFILISGGFIEGLLLLNFCKKNGISFLIERADENRRKFFKKKRFKDHLAIMYEDLFDRYIIKKCDTLFVVSRYLEAKYTEMHKDSNVIRSTPSFVDIKKFELQSNVHLESFITVEQANKLISGKINIVFCGSYIFHNGIDFFLECASELINVQKMDFQIVFVLFKGHMKILNDKINRLNLKEHFLLIENVKSEHIPAIYRYSDILVLPEMGIEVANAGFPGKVAEYLASGKVIISTDFSNLKDFLQHNNNVMMSPIGDKDKYISNLAKLITNSSLRERLGANAKNTAIDNFSLTKGIKYFVDAIQNNPTYQKDFHGQN